MRRATTPEQRIAGIRNTAAYLRSMAEKQRELAVEYDERAAHFERRADQLEGIEYVESLKPLIAELPSRDRKILSLRFVANMTQSEIGEELGISQMHVSRLLARTLTQLREGLTTED